jgi:phage tail protein X
MRKILLALVTAMVVSGCGAYAIGSNPSPGPSSGPGLNFDVVVTEKDHAATMRVGQTIEVVLHANNGMNGWQQVKSSNESILVPIVNPAATAVRGVTLAAFQAKAAGQAEITAYASPTCPSGSACPMYVAVFSVKVTVTQ